MASFPGDPREDGAIEIVDLEEFAMNQEMK